MAKAVNKQQWILSQPFDLSALAVVELGKKKGIKLSPAAVHVARSIHRKRLQAAGKPLPAGLEPKGRNGKPKVAAPEGEAPRQKRAYVRRKPLNGQSHASIDLQALTEEESALCELSMQVGFTRASAVLSAFRDSCLSLSKAKQ